VLYLLPHPSLWAMEIKGERTAAPHSPSRNSFRRPFSPSPGPGLFRLSLTDVTRRSISSGSNPAPLHCDVQADPLFSRRTRFKSFFPPVRLLRLVPLRGFFFFPLHGILSFVHHCVMQESTPPPCGATSLGPIPVSLRDSDCRRSFLHIFVLSKIV